MKINDTVSFGAVFKIENADTAKASKQLRRLKNRLAKRKEPDVSVQKDDISKKILVTTSRDTYTFNKELDVFDVEGVSQDDYLKSKSNLIAEWCNKITLKKAK